MDKLASIIIPTYKGSSHIARAVQTALKQTYKNTEIIIVDDNGKNTKEQKKTQRIVETFSDKRIQYVVHKTNLNGAAARNTGLRLSKGNYICFLDDDDLYTENRVEDAIDYLNKNSKYDGVFTNVLCCDEELKATRLVEIEKEGDCTKNLLLNEMFFGTGSNIFITRKAQEKIGYFDENLLRHQDLEFMIRFYRYFETGSINKIEIIKSKNGNNNMPDYDKLIVNEKYYNHKFNNEINKLRIDERRLYFKNQKNRLELSYVIKQNRPSNILHIFLSQPMNNRLLILVKKMGLENTAIYRFMIRIRNWQKNKKIQKSLSADVISFLKEWGLK